VRDTANAHDPKHAMLVRTRDGKPCGYLPKEIAGVISGRLEESKHLAATVIELQLAEDVFRLRIALSVPEAWLADGLASGSSARFAYDFEVSSDHAYLLLNGGAGDRERVARLLADSGIAVGRGGLCHRPASCGRQYQWFFRFDPQAGDGSAPAAVGQLLFAATGVMSDSSAERRMADLAREREQLARRLAESEQTAAESMALAEEMDEEAAAKAFVAGQLKDELAKVEAELHDYREKYDQLVVYVPKPSADDDVIPVRVREAVMGIAGALPPAQLLALLQGLYLALWS
jgi:hypothetical protein